MVARKIPSKLYEGMPCSSVAVSCALGTPLLQKTSHDDGWMTLKDQNRFIRGNLPVQKTIYYKRGERPALRDWLSGFTGRAIVCVYGHYLYAEGEMYWSFFNNDGDDVVQVWILKDHF